ncbi:MAG: DUF4388 domain-containing protein [Chloroflexi bacterium]|nr:DUF4388 domain-containing protein [Chloroflexota bacterium]
MALKGNLRDFSVTQLLNLINLARKTGMLRVRGPEAQASIYFREGKLAYAGLSHEANDLATILYRDKRLTSGQYRILRERAGQMTDKALGLLLVNGGYLSQEDILHSLQAFYVDVVKRLFAWAEGYFEFDAKAPPPAGKILTRIDLENLIIEGARHLREWEQLQDEIPDLDMALKFVDRPGTNLRNLNLSVEEWRVVSYINPKNTIRQIARATKMNDLEIRRIVYGLLQAGLVELVRPERAVAPKRQIHTALEGKTKEEQRSLVNRLISRIRGL